jgi:hypothetical protein
MEADFVLYGGLHREGRMVDILAALNSRVPGVHPRRSRGA